MVTSVTEGGASARVDMSVIDGGLSQPVTVRLVALGVTATGVCVCVCLALKGTYVCSTSSVRLLRIVKGLGIVVEILHAAQPFFSLSQ